MDKIEKALQKLSKKERDVTQKILNRLLKNQLTGLDRKKLKGHSDIFRIRKGDIRIVYRVDPARQIFILAIERRSEETYREF